MTALTHFTSEQLAQAWSCVFDDNDVALNAEIKAALTSQQGLFDKAILVSDYLAKLWKKNPHILLQLISVQQLHIDLTQADFHGQLKPLLECIDTNAFDKSLRESRAYHMSRFIVRDMHRMCSTQQLIFELSCFANSMIELVIAWHYPRFCQRYGAPIGQVSNKAQSLVVLAMGKLGAYELNLSSDIDLIFAYPESGETNGELSIANQQFFLKLSQAVVRSLDRVTADGFVFRTDMRLRPYGQGGALALNFDALELYYGEQGREWERYAMIKARPISVDENAGDELMARLKPFIYRKYTDFSAIQALRDMKMLIDQQVTRLAKQNDVKLGAGGIREIEFIAQSCQLIHGGRDENLQQRGVVKVLEYLCGRELLPRFDDRCLLNGDLSCSGLVSAYYFLRNCEHAIQALNDEQSQTIPSDEKGLKQFLAYLNYTNAAEFHRDYDRHRSVVRQYFSEIVADKTENIESISKNLQALWQQSRNKDFAETLLEQGFDESQVALLDRFAKSSDIKRLNSIALERLQQFMNTLLSLINESPCDDKVLDAVLDLAVVILRRSSYFVLFNENPIVINRLLTLAAASPWLMGQIIKQPVLLDELISSKGLGQVPDVAQLNNHLQQQSLRIDVCDMEQQMQMLRYFKLSHQLHIIAAEVFGTLPLMRVSDYLSFVAEAILAYVQDLAWQQMCIKYGQPMRAGELCNRRSFAVIAYGKLGSIELSHNSDLDLVFLYDADIQSDTEGGVDHRSINNREFFTRMGQRIIQLLSTITALGRLYEIDMRLRPSGGKGLLVSRINAFDDYQRSEAWTWEKQALVRARAIVGDTELIERFNQIRQRSLTESRDLDTLRQEVSEMREKMHRHLLPAVCKKRCDELFHLKHSRGGIVDIEFMVQYCVLAFGWRYPELVRFTDNIRILQSLANTGLIPAKKTQQVIDAYQYYRSLSHQQALKEQGSIVTLQQVNVQRNRVLSFWNQLFNAV